MFALTQTQRTGLFVDGAHLHAIQKTLDFGFDFTRLLHLFQRQSTLVVNRYYTLTGSSMKQTDEPNVPWGNDKYDPTHGVVKYLSCNGWECITKPRTLGANNILQNIYVEMSVDILRYSYENDLDKIYIFSGTRDLAYVVKILRDDEIPTVVCSTKQGKSNIFSQDLGTVTRDFIDLNEHRKLFERKTA